jgi:hypothetical protein
VSWLVEAQPSFNTQALQVPDMRVSRFQEMNKHKSWTKSEHTSHIVTQTLSMFYSIFQVTQLKQKYADKEGFTYDYVVRVRFDAVPQQPLICKDFEPDFLWFQKFNQPDNFVFDWINFGSNRVMNVFGSIFLLLEHLNCFQFFTKEMRQVNTWEPSDICGAFNEGTIRDAMTLFHIPTKSFNVNLALGVEFFPCKRVLVVTSTYKDQDILDQWVNKVAGLSSGNIVYDVLVYKKDDSLTHNEEISESEFCKRIPNCGKCDYAFFHYIVSNYTTMHKYDSIVFTTCNWAHENIPFLRFLSEAHKYDFSDTGNSPKMQIWDKKLISHIPKGCEIDYEIRVEEQIADIVSETAWDWYRHIFPQVEPPHAFLPAWGNGPVFAVSPRLIKRHQIEVYQYMLDRFHHSTWNCDVGLLLYKTMERLSVDVGLRYHNHCLRFYRLLFTHECKGFNVQSFEKKRNAHYS